MGIKTIVNVIHKYCCSECGEIYVDEIQSNSAIMIQITVKEDLSSLFQKYICQVVDNACIKCASQLVKHTNGLQIF